MITRFLITGLLLIAATGCNPSSGDHSAQIQKMEDTLFKSFPTVNRVSVEVRGDFGIQVHVTLGDAELYNAPEATRKETTDRISAITGHVFSEDKPGKGSVTFVKEENTITVDEASKKTYPMSLTTNN